MNNSINFETALMSEILSNLNNNFTDNHDIYRFGELPKEKTSFKSVIKKPFEKLLSGRHFYKQLDRNYNQPSAALKQIDEYLPGLRNLFYMLSDEKSKLLLTKLIAYRILGNKKVKLPLNTKEYWAGIKDIETITDFNDAISIKFMSWKLYLIDLQKKNIPIVLYFFPAAVYVDFILKQYEYHSPDKTIKVQKGDYVIDAGGCYGDTALYFANETGAGGKVFTYEFIPSNLDILYKNLALNNELKQRINIIEKPVWESSGIPMYFIDNGPGSKVFMNDVEKYDGQANSLSIDDLVEQQQIPRVDFIKMDIEGAELYALKGALKTIKKFKPTLAIAIYHSWEDFINIPEFINSLDLGYEFCLGHYTIHAEETIIFAKAIR